MTDEFTIAILGGMGTYATIHAFEQYASIFPAEKEWDRPRLLIDNRCTMPSRVRAFLYHERVDELVADISESLHRLLETGGEATRVILACNTSHLFLPQVFEQYPELESHVMDIINATVNDIQSNHIEEVYLLGSEGTIDAGIYQERLGRMSISCTNPTGADYTALRTCIEAVKQNHYTDETELLFCNLMHGHDHVILGCTELPILYQRYRDRIPTCRVYDPIETALVQIRQEYLNH